MAHIVLADDGIEFDGTTPERGPLGGAESAVIALLEALAARGHVVQGFTRCAVAVAHKGVDWRPLGEGLPDSADLYIANRADHLIGALPGARRTVFWIHNPATYLLKLRYLWPLLRHRPPIVFIGDYHARTCPGWVPSGGRHVIPYGLTETFHGRAEADTPPPPRAVFTSNPLRGLDWLLDLWAGDIRPRAPEAELHLFCGPAVYGSHGGRHGAAMQAMLDQARATPGVVLREPLPKAALAEELLKARVLLYRGDLNETFCAAVAEAQALGVPAVVTPLGSMPERVRDGATGVVAQTDSAFAQAAVDLLTNQTTWWPMHRAALAAGAGLTWDRAASAFESLIPIKETP
ncbi:glycosyltransferase [Roseospirillum parvum]|uniref:Glycosyltransferase involved in cell wall bisynthesis n=1 Tax=Roseospirillum parvum TaxID=83401 RepID=A0A1G7U1C3_9PROT|nr:glycosyltransferase [Roseospirillum parvum]SDG41402.1 Glycosyltransferase involved in cell wall bisynthesis [Roseospirillum parvum]